MSFGELLRFLLEAAEACDYVYRSCGHDEVEGGKNLESGDFGTPSRQWKLATMPSCDAAVSYLAHEVVPKTIKLSWIIMVRVVFLRGSNVEGRTRISEINSLVIP